MQNEQYLKKVISSKAIIGSIRSKADRSLSLNISTPELTSDERARFMDLQNVNGHLVFTPDEDVAPEPLKIDRDLKQKSQSTRMRGVLFVLWDKTKPDEDFETFYKLETEKMISEVKERIPEL